MYQTPKKYFVKYPWQEDIEVNEDVYEVLKDSALKQEWKYDYELRSHIENKKTLEQVENEKNKQKCSRWWKLTHRRNI